MTATDEGASRLPALRLHPERLAVYRLEAGDVLPIPADGTLVAEIRTGSVRTLIREEGATPRAPGAVESGFRAFEVVGPLDFSLVGVLAGYLTPLARAAIPVFVLSTFDTDWILVRQERLEAAVAALEQAGIEISRADSGAWAPDRPPAPARP